MHDKDLRHGCAIGESIAGLSRSKLSRFVAKPTAFEPSRLVPSHGTEGMLVTVQSLLLSQAMSEIFVMHLKSRLGWYQLTQ
ncbi:MAG: hypothetical protein ACKO9Q_02180, partial [Pirellula sp.]